MYAKSTIYQNSIVAIGLFSIVKHSAFCVHCGKIVLFIKRH